jgi:hypothetical protein
MCLEIEAGRGARTLDHLAKPAVENGAPRSEVNTNSDAALSRCSRRGVRISLPRRGCVAGVPVLPPNVERAPGEVDLCPLWVHKLDSA